MSDKRVYSINTELYKVTGVQKVLMDIHNAIKDTYIAKIVGTINYNKVDSNHKIKKDDYQKLKNPFMFYKSIVIVHERKLLFLLWLLNTFFFQKIKIIYVHHNVMYGHKFLSKMPKTIVGISDNCIKNLTDYFKVPKENIHKIYNCVVDIHPSVHKPPIKESIKILYPARINEQKQQIEIVKQLKGKIDKKIKIFFAGDGPNLIKLKEVIGNDSQFEILGFRNDIHQLLQECDYMMLYSKHEGLPITLIEACMCGTPILCSNVGGNAEICKTEQNGWVIEQWDELIDKINHLVFINEEEYRNLSKKGRDRYEQFFTFKEFKTNYIDLVKNAQ